MSSYCFSCLRRYILSSWILNEIPAGLSLIGCSLFLFVCFFFSALCIYHNIPFCPAKFLQKNQLMILWAFVCMTLCFSLHALSIIYLIFAIIIVICLGVDLFGFIFLWDSLCFLYLYIYIILQVWDIFIHNFIKYIFNFLLSPHFGTPIKHIFLCWILYYRPLNLSSFLICFSLGCSDWVIFIILSSRSPIHSSVSPSLLLISFSVFHFSYDIIYSWIGFLYILVPG